MHSALLLVVLKNDFWVTKSLETAIGCFVEAQNMAAVTMECLHDLSTITEPVIKDERGFPPESQ